MPSSWSRTKINEATAQRLYAATKPKDSTPSRTYVNSTMRESYTGNSMHPVRDGADQHKQYTGAGFRAQIERSV